MGAVAVDFSPRAIADAKLAIADVLRCYDAIQALAAIVGFSSFGAAETYSEPRTAPSTRMEYVATVLLERSDARGLRVMTAAQTMRASRAIQVALDHSQLIAGQTTFSLLSRRASSEDPLDAIAAHLQLVDTAIRGPGYEEQAKSFLAAAFADEEVEAALVEQLGFGAETALAVEEAATGMIERRYRAAIDISRALSAHPQELAFQMQRQADQVLCLTAEALDEEGGVPRDVVQRFLDRFSVRFGSARGTHLLTNGHKIRGRPLVDAGDGRFLWTSAVNLLWAIPAALEEALKERDGWETYQARRALIVEQMSVVPLAEAVRADGAWTNLRFRINGAPEHEIDGLVVVDDICFVVEAKSGRLSRQARRGRKRELGPALEALVGRASSQSLRLATAIRREDKITFADDAGADLEIDLRSVRRVEPLIVTLEDSSWLSRHEPELIALGLLDAEAPPPWIVSAFDLETICKTLEFPGQLTLYLDGRRRLPPRMEVGDELNLWMIHLLKKLEFPQDSTVVLRGDWTEDLDRFFMFGHGTLPRMALTPSVRREVAREDRLRRPGHVRRTEDLMASDQAARLPEPSPIHSSRDVLADIAFGPAHRHLQG